MPRLPGTPYAQSQLLLSAVYVGVCGFRSLFPRVDLERICLWDSWLSTIILGRTAATIAELCFALQCGLFVQRLADLTGMPLLSAMSLTFVPLAVVAEIACWYAVLSLDHIGHALEETLWAVIMLILATASGAAGLQSEGLRAWLLLAGALIYTGGAALTLAFDVTMYVGRWRSWATVDSTAAGDGPARLWASARADPDVGGLARGGGVDDALLQRRSVDEPCHGPPRTSVSSEAGVQASGRRQERYRTRMCASMDASRFPARGALNVTASTIVLVPARETS